MHALIYDILRSFPFFLVISFYCSSMLPAQSSDPSSPIRVMSFNIRYDNPNDGFNAWPHRKEIVASTIRFHGVDLIGLQEALHHQLEALRTLLPEYHFIGIGRDDGQAAGEYAAIGYRRIRFQLLEDSTFWLSETPDVPSNGWDADLHRIVSWGKFVDLSQPEDTFFHFNTHYDHRGEEARKNSSSLLVTQIDRLNPEGLPTIITGDFNMTPESEPYKILTSTDHQPPIIDGFLSSNRTVHGPVGTTSGFSFPGRDRRIDYVFTRHSVAVLQYGHMSDSWSGRFPSDHLPVLAEVLLHPTQALPNAHAHNDYEHDQPLIEALAHGCTSIEVDIHAIDDQLIVSHDPPKDMTQVSTLEELYLAPLAKHIDAHQGKVYPNYGAPIYLMIDLKTPGELTYPLLTQVLQKYAFMLDHKRGETRYRGPVRVFLSGNRPMELVQADTLQLAGLDGRPDDLGKGYDAYIMPVISSHYKQIISWEGEGDISAEERKVLTTLAEKAHKEGKLVRLWASPEKEQVWKALRESGIDLINTDELDRVQSFLLEEMARY